MRRSFLVTLMALGLVGCGVPDANMAKAPMAAEPVLTDAEVLAAEAAAPSPEAADLVIAQAPAAEPAAPGGLMGLLRRVAPAPAAAVDVAETDATQTDTEAVVAAVTEDTVEAPTPAAAEPAQAQVILASAQAPAPKSRRKGLFARLGSAATPARAPAAAMGLTEVDYDTVLPYGQIARSCAAKRQPLGRRVEKASAKGFMLYDTNPRTTDPRSFYITGFADGCPRKLTGSHVMLGAPSLYEQLHYSAIGADLTVGETDKAYEKVKGQVCGVRKGKPCGSKMSQLERSTFFVISYAQPDDNTRWAEALVHDGEVLAHEVKSSN